MILKETSFMKIRQDAEKHIGEEVDVKIDVGRNKVENYRGVIEGAHENFFYIKRSDINTKATVPYAQVLTNSLEITSVSSGESLLNYEFDTSKKTVQL